MRQPALVLAVSALLFVVSLQGLHAQSTAGSTTSTGASAANKFGPIRDDKAVAAVQAAIAAFGGTPTVTVPVQVQAQMQATTAGGSVTGTITWEMSGSQFRVASSFGGATSVMTTGHGNPTAAANGNSRAVPTYVAQAIFIPALAGPILANEFQNSSYSLRYIGPKTVNGTAVTAIETSLSGSPIKSRLTAQIWYFSNATNLPVRVEYRLPAEQIEQASFPAAVDLSNYAASGGGFYPFNIVLYHGAKQVGAITLQSVNTNASIPSTDFDPPTGGAQ
jgi:hypothetical protein